MPPQKRLDIVSEPEEAAHYLRAIINEVDHEIDVASGGVKLVGGGCRAKDFELANAMLLAKRDDGWQVVGNQIDH